MGLGKFGWGKYGTGKIWVRANMGPGLSKLDLGQIWDRANMAGQIWSRQTWPGKLGLGKYGLTPSERIHIEQNYFGQTWPLGLRVIYSIGSINIINCITVYGTYVNVIV